MSDGSCFQELLKKHNLDPDIYDVVSKLTPLETNQKDKDEPKLFFIPVLCNKE